MKKPTKRSLVIDGSNCCEDWEWEDVCMTLTDAMEKCNSSILDLSYWYAEMINFGWTGACGEQYFKAEDGKTLLSKILPDTECSFRIYKRSKTILINNAHHDSPMWAEWYVIRQATEEEVNENIL